MENYLIKLMSYSGILSGSVIAGGLLPLYFKKTREYLQRAGFRSVEMHRHELEGLELLTVDERLQASVAERQDTGA